MVKEKMQCLFLLDHVSHRARRKIAMICGEEDLETREREREGRRRSETNTQRDERDK